MTSDEPEGRALPWNDADVNDLEWAMWFARKVKGTSRAAAIRALEQNPTLRFSEREAELRRSISEKVIRFCLDHGINPAEFRALIEGSDPASPDSTVTVPHYGNVQQGADPASPEQELDATGEGQ